MSRRDLQWNQDELERRSGVSRGYISNIERGHTKNVGIEMIFSLANALEVSVAFLLGLTDDPLKDLSDVDAISMDDSGFDELTRDFLNIFQQLADDKKKTLLDLAKMLRSSDAPRIVGEKT